MKHIKKILILLFLSIILTSCNTKQDIELNHLYETDNYRFTIDKVMVYNKVDTLLPTEESYYIVNNIKENTFIQFFITLNKDDDEEITFNELINGSLNIDNTDYLFGFYLDSEDGLSIESADKVDTNNHLRIAIEVPKDLLKKPMILKLQIDDFKGELKFDLDDISEPENNITLNETFTFDDDVIFSILDVEINEEYHPDNPPEEHTFYSAKEDKSLLILKTKISNNSKEDIDINEIYNIRVSYDGIEQTSFSLRQNKDKTKFEYEPILKSDETSTIDFIFEIDNKNKDKKPVFLFRKDDKTFYYDHQ